MSIVYGVLTDEMGVDRGLSDIYVTVISNVKFLAYLGCCINECGYCPCPWCQIFFSGSVQCRMSMSP